MNDSKLKRGLAAIGLTVVMALTGAGCTQGSSAPADDASTGSASTGSVTVSVIGPAADQDAYYAPQTEVALAEGVDAWAASQQVFDQYKLVYDASNTDYGVMLNSIENPLDGHALAYDEATGCYWQLFVDGAASEVGIDGVELADGTSIVWYYSAFGDELPAGELALVEALDSAA